MHRYFLGSVTFYHLFHHRLTHRCFLSNLILMIYAFCKHSINICLGCVFVCWCLWWARLLGWIDGSFALMIFAFFKEMMNVFLCCVAFFCHWQLLNFDDLCITRSTSILTLGRHQEVVVAVCYTSFRICLIAKDQMDQVLLGFHSMSIDGILVY